MPAGCVRCDDGKLECGPDVGELCAGSGGWTKAGALCLQFWVAKDKKGNCKISVDIHPLGECGGEALVCYPQKPGLVQKAPVGKTKKNKKR